MTHEGDSATLGCAAEECNLGTHLFDFLSILEQSAPSRSSHSPFEIVEIFDESDQSIFINLDNVSESDLDSNQVTRTEMHDEFADNRVRLFVRCRRNRCQNTMLLDIDTEHHTNDIKLLPKSRAETGTEVKKRLSNAGANELGSVFFRKLLYLGNNVLREDVFTIRRIRTYVDFVNTEIDGVVGVVHSETDFNGMLALKNEGRYAEIELLTRCQFKDSGVTNLEIWTYPEPCNVASMDTFASLVKS
jgi:hypothetical protein